jgi:hypothetical protein
MTIVLNHLVVAVESKDRAAGLLADLLGVDVGSAAGPFAPVSINEDLTFDFDDRRGSLPGHYAFLVDDATFDHALATAKASRLPWGSAPRTADFEINFCNGGRGVYIRDPDGIAYEFFTAVP